MSRPCRAKLGGRRRPERLRVSWRHAIVGESRCVAKSNCHRNVNSRRQNGQMNCRHTQTTRIKTKASPRYQISINLPQDVYRLLASSLGLLLNIEDGIWSFTL